MRQRTLDVAGVAVGDAVLDVGCGTGTLALAAKRRVGDGGSVHGVDASAEMIARSETKMAYWPRSTRSRSSTPESTRTCSTRRRS
jgi:ubiquinone/menaquinone biosynthesis C-methylase UbiE